ncbi:hypothetical protein CQW23_24851 [Capsicum baccatum]|uniref:DUF4220 domain-containing protein n=1 Tax=Capsicum baccatum TaxID=33114 RepID=A0A2G2VW14_CAPBA|nr:hypothetical protein CQW23_24851 [Capsicum baccatum]
MRGVTELISKNIIQPVYDKCPFKKKAHSYKLQPLAYTAVTMLAEREKFIDFDEQGNPMREYSRSLRSCLVSQKDNKLENEAESSHGRNYNSNSRTTSSSKSGNSKPIMAHVVYNLNDVFLQLKREWFTEMKHVNILYLGRWESTSEKHIELEEPKDLEGLANLNVLDLRACHSLEVIPQGIGSLHNLTHLDLLECYLLSGMPKGLRELRNLVVLKGFEVQDSAEKSHSCTLEDLLAMKKLRKLSIHTEIEVFPRCSDLDVLAKFKQLRILTIEWGGNLFRNNPDSYKTCYLLVEWAANFAVGHISDSNKGNGNNSAGENKVEDVLVFWAAFLLVHLSGPDTISAFALENNTLWHRHFGGAVAYVFFPTVSRNKLWIPAVLIYVSGVIKYGERIWALYLASLDRFRESNMKDPDPGPNYAKLMDEYSSKIAANLPTNIKIEGKEEKTDMKNREKTEKLQCIHSYSIQQNIYYKWSENIP